MPELIEQLTNINQVHIEIIKKRLTRREHFWLNKLKALKLHGLKRKLNQI